ncbi:MAG: YezD family protein [Oscillospiraceae bacterium]|jgi:hypothetical protein|nr:YezD family protein [Oscillospiraceae bacterium]
MERRQISEDKTDFARFVREQLSQSSDGAITVSKQAGKVSHLTLTQSRASPRKTQEDTGQRKNGVLISDEELLDILADIDSVEYGTVILRLQNSKIIGVEKNESIKL